MPFPGSWSMLLLEENSREGPALQAGLRRRFPDSDVLLCEDIRCLTGKVEEIGGKLDVVICPEEFCGASAGDIHALLRETGLTVPMVLLLKTGQPGELQELLPPDVKDYLLKDEAGNYRDLLPVLVDKVLNRKKDDEAVLAFGPDSLNGSDEEAICEGDLWRDLPHRVHMEKEVRRLRSWLFALLSGGSAGVAVELENGRIGMANGEFCKVLKLDASPRELAGRRVSSVLESVRSLFRRPELFLARAGLGIRETEPVEAEEWTLVDGRVLELNLTPVRSRAGVKGRIWSFLDITAKKREEKALRWATRMEATSTLAGGIAHDFNNLMLAVMGNADLLRSRVEGDPAACRMLDSITEAAGRAGDLSQKMLAYARGGRYRPRKMNLNEMVEKVARRQASEQDPRIRIELDLEERLDPVKADAGQLGMSLTGLLVNASEAIESKGVILVSTANVNLGPNEVQDLPGLRPGPHVMLTVKDSGCGMEEKTLSRIFEPYYSTKFQGRGLSLAAVYGIIKNHAGHIQVASRPGLGSVFRVYLPVIEERRPAEPRSAKPLRPVYTRGDETILVIDDDAMVLDVLQKALEVQGFKILKARDGEEALWIARNHKGRIDLSILDLGMPGMDGTEVFPLLKEARPEMRVLICSGYEMDQVSSSLLRQGASGFLAKPFTMSRLLPEVRKVLERNREPKES